MLFNAAFHIYVNAAFGFSKVAFRGNAAPALYYVAEARQRIYCDAGAEASSAKAIFLNEYSCGRHARSNPRSGVSRDV